MIWRQQLHQIAANILIEMAEEVATVFGRNPFEQGDGGVSISRSDVGFELFVLLLACVFWHERNLARLRAKEKSRKDRPP